MIEFHQVTKRYSAHSAALTDIDLSVSGRIGFPGGAFRRRQIDLVENDRRHRTTQFRHGHGQRPGHRQTQDLRAALFAPQPGLILQQQRLLVDRDILANVMLPLVVSGATRADAEKRARAALDKVGLLDKASRSRSVCPAANSSAQQSPAPSSIVRKSSWPTNPPPIWIAATPTRYWMRCGRSTASASPA